MLDLLMVTLLAAAFAGSVGYVAACQRLTEPNGSSRENLP